MPRTNVGTSPAPRKEYGINPNLAIPVIDKKIVQLTKEGSPLEWARLELLTNLKMAKSLAENAIYYKDVAPHHIISKVESKQEFDEDAYTRSSQAVRADG